MDNLIYHDVQQGSDAWLHIKSGKFGGTTAGTFTVKGKSADGIGAGLRSLIYRKAAQTVTGPDLDGFTSKAMQRGNDLEPFARKRYEMENFVDVAQIGYIQRGEYFGVSPDGLVGEDGAIEIKCLEGPAWVEWYVDGQTVDCIPKDYYNQMQWLMFITGREWCDYVVFNPDFAPLDYTQIRVERDDSVISTFAEKCIFVADEMTRILNKVAKKEEL